MQLGHFKKSRQKRPMLSEINITPMVDVMLVLLVIFMITSPMMVAGINVDLPETKNSPVAVEDEPLTVTVTSKGTIHIAETEIDIHELSSKVIAITKEKMDSRIFVRGDKNVYYGKVVEVIGELNAAGFSRVALITNIKTDDKK
jgi:biopolymer transport protein TolR